MSDPHQAAMDLFAAQRYQEAFERFESLLEDAVEPNDRYNALCFLGKSALELERFDRALTALMAALQMAPSDARIPLLLGDTYLSRGQAALLRGEKGDADFNEALNYFRRGRALSEPGATHLPNCDYNIACMASRLGFHDEMLEALSRAISADESQRADARVDDDILCSQQVPALRELLGL